MADSTQKIYRENFAEIAPPLLPEEAALEASRCLYCYDAPCIKACPTHIDIPRFIKQIESKNLVGSAKTILEANAMGHSCARVCPVEVLCEGACVYHDWQEKPISIALLQRRATDHLYERKIQAFKPGPDNGRRVAIVGAGPAGLSCATYLRRLGYAVTIFERGKLAGGLNTHGVAEYKMSQETALAEVKAVFDFGVDVKLGVEVGRDIPCEQLLRDFDALFIGIGLGETNALRVPGEDLPGVWDALSFIRHVKARALKPLGSSMVTIVIGAGNTAIDAVTQAKRTGAAKVIMAYRRGADEMSAYSFEHDLAKRDGAEFLWNAAPVRLLGKKRVEGVEFVRTAGKDGKLAPVPGSKFKIACDRVIKAIGQTKHYSLAKAFGLELTTDGRIKVDAGSLASSNPRVFTGGDAINGGKEVVNAVADGKRAAYGIHRAVTGGATVPPGNDYWISTIEGRSVAAIPSRAAGSRG